MIISSCICVSFFVAELILHCLYVSHLIYPFICHWTFMLFPCLAVVNSAAMNIGVHVSFRIIVFSGYRSRSGLDPLVIFSFLRNLHTV